jgi:hypothetical protein
MVRSIMSPQLERGETGGCQLVNRQGTSKGYQQDLSAPVADFFETFAAGMLEKAH